MWIFFLNFSIRGGSIGTLAKEHNRNGTHEDPDIEPDTPVGNVEKIVLHSFCIGSVIAAGNLPHAGNSRAHADVVIEDRTIFFPFILDNGSRSHKTHGATDHVIELRQFVQGGTAQKMPHGARPWGG